MAGSELIADDKKRFNQFLLRDCKRPRSPAGTLFEGLLKTSARCLQEKPDDFNYYALEVAKMRRKVVFQEFINAKRCRGPGEMLPNEVNACDLLAYLNFLLRWLPGTVQSEIRLLLELLFPDLAAYTGPIDTDFSDVRTANFEKEKSVYTYVLNEIFEVFCKPLEVLVGRILQFEHLAITCELSDMLEECWCDMPRRFPGDAFLSRTLWTLYDAAHRTFLDKFNALKPKQLPLVPVDLSPPVVLTDGVSMLLELIEVHDKYRTQATLDVELVVSIFLNPILQMCEQAMMGHKANESLLTSGTDPGQLLASAADDSSSPTYQTNDIMDFLVNCLNFMRQSLEKKKKPLSPDFKIYPSLEEVALELDEILESLNGCPEKKFVDAVLHTRNAPEKMLHFCKLLNDEETSTPETV